MNIQQTLKKLRALGSAQTRKTYGRHGVTGEMFGVKYGDLDKMVKQIGVDHELALALWKSENHDARILATMIADPEKTTGKLLTTWIKAVDNHVLSHAIATLAAKSAAGRKLMTRWMEARGEWPAAIGWGVLSRAASEPGALTTTEARKLLATIEKRIHSSKNRVKYSMNNAMISLGAYVPGLEDHAVKVAERIGQVEVDHGLTNCQTPLASPYIRKAAAHHRAKLAKQSARRPAAKKAPRRPAAKRAGRKRSTRAVAR